MATWQLIENTSRTLVRLLEEHVAAALPAQNVQVVVATPHAFSSLKSAGQSTISVFLYRVAEHAELRNSPPLRRSDGVTRRAPLALELSYLITPWGARGQSVAVNDNAAALEEHKLLGVILQALYDKCELSRAELDENPTLPPVWGERDNLQVLLETLPIEDLYRIWDSSELPYQLSATYRVRVLALESTEIWRGPPVIDAALRLGRPA